LGIPQSLNQCAENQAEQITIWKIIAFRESPNLICSWNVHSTDPVWLNNANQHSLTFGNNTFEVLWVNSPWFHGLGLDFPSLLFDLDLQLLDLESEHS
jgi:hypothetical protein